MRAFITYVFLFLFGLVFCFWFVCGGRNRGFVSLPSVILIIMFASFSECIKIYIVIIIVWFALLTYDNELDDLLGKSSFNDFSQWLTWKFGHSCQMCHVGQGSEYHVTKHM